MKRTVSHRDSAYRAVNTVNLGYTKTNLLMLYKTKDAVCSEMRTKHKRSVGTMQSFWMLNLAVRKVTARLQKVT